jgi:hypothetical protein
MLVHLAQQSILYMGDQQTRLDDNDGDLGGDRDGGRAPLSAKFAAYGESLAPDERFREAKEEKVAGEAFEVGVGGVSAPIFKRDVVVGRRGDSSKVHDARLSDSPRVTNASRSRICQPKRPHTSDDGAFLSLPMHIN